MTNGIAADELAFTYVLANEALLVRTLLAKLRARQGLISDFSNVGAYDLDITRIEFLIGPERFPADDNRIVMRDVQQSPSVFRPSLAGAARQDIGLHASPRGFPGIGKRQPHPAVRRQIRIELIDPHVDAGFREGILADDLIDGRPANLIRRRCVRCRLAVSEPSSEKNEESR